MAQASAEKIKQTDPSEKERIASVGKDARAAFAKKRNRAISPDHTLEENQDDQKPHLGQRGVITERKGCTQ